MATARSPSAEVSAAHDRGRRPPKRYVKRRSEVFAKLDTNKDGNLSAAEFNAGSPVPQRQLPAAAEVLGQIGREQGQ